MPLLRYFVYVGGALLALILVFNWYLPPLNEEAERDSVDRSIIRIHSQQKWPAAVVMDTTQPTIVPPAATAAAAAAVEAPVARPPREAFAMAEATPAVKPAETVKPAKPHARRPRVARAPVSRDAGYDSFGPRNESFGFRSDFFGSRSMWSSRW